MEKETFLSGYCRCIDGSRMVTVITVDGCLEEVDCGFGNCPHQPNCTIARQIANACTVHSESLPV